MQVIEGTNIAVFQPNSDVLAIIKLFLEKYEVLSEEDKAMYRTIIWALSNPPRMVMSTENGE